MARHVSVILMAICLYVALNLIYSDVPPSVPTSEPQPAQGIDAALSTIKSVSREGEGNESASKAWQSLIQAGMPAFFPTLSAMKDASAVATNWLRTAVETIAERETQAGRPLPSDQLADFVRDSAQSPHARRLAFELLTQQRPESRNDLLPGLINDPNLDLRRDAIAFRWAKLDAEGKKKASDYRELFDAARDKDQVEALAKILTELGEKPSITEHFGYVTHWKLIGPFDSTDNKGFEVAYPPETTVDLAARHVGKNGLELSWVPFVTTDRYATVDLNKGLGKHKFAAGYAFARIQSDRELPTEIRIASQNAIKIFLNGQPVFQREEYHHGTRMDQHIGRGILKPGVNELLVKICQNNQDQDWAQAWAIQCRLCDATGGALPVTQDAGGGTFVRLGFTPRPMEPEPKKKR